jgi:hypothetical protein
VRGGRGRGGNLTPRGQRAAARGHARHRASHPRRGRPLSRRALGHPGRRRPSREAAARWSALRGACEGSWRGSCVLVSGMVLRYWGVGGGGGGVEMHKRGGG